MFLPTYAFINKLNKVKNQNSPWTLVYSDCFYWKLYKHTIYQMVRLFNYFNAINRITITSVCMYYVLYLYIIYVILK